MRFFLILILLISAELKAESYTYPNAFNWEKFGYFQLPATGMSALSAYYPDQGGLIQFSAALLLMSKGTMSDIEPISWGFLTIGLYNMSVEDEEEKRLEIFLVNYTVLNFVYLLKWGGGANTDGNSYIWRPVIYRDGAKILISYKF